jgi:hypothetical protein
VRLTEALSKLESHKMKQATLAASHAKAAEEVYDAQLAHHICQLQLGKTQ